MIKWYGGKNSRWVIFFDGKIRWQRFRPFGFYTPIMFKSKFPSEVKNVK